MAIVVFQCPITGNRVHQSVADALSDDGATSGVSTVTEAGRSGQATATDGSGGDSGFLEAV
jgi:hypothetical protein